MRSESFFDLDGDLIVVQAIVVGPKGRVDGNFILDTGATLTTLVPEIAAALGYTRDQRLLWSSVQSTVGVERGYIVRASKLTALGLTLANVAVNVAALTHGLDGLLGMSFLNELNYDIRTGERRILAEKLTP